MTGAPPSVPRRLSVVHSALVVGVVVIMLVFGVVRELATFQSAPELLTVFRIVAFAELAAVVLVARVLWGRVSPLREAANVVQWWSGQAGRLIIVWSLAEGAAMLGGVLWLLTGDRLILVGVTGVALALLVMYRPSRVAER